MTELERDIQGASRRSAFDVLRSWRGGTMLGDGAQEWRSRLGRKLLVRILLFSMTLASLATLVQLFFEYEWDVGAIHTRFAEIERSRVKSVADSLWEFDRGLTQIQIEEIRELPDIARVELDTTLGEHFAVGSAAAATSTIREEYALYSPKRQGLRLGTLRVIASLDGVYSRLWSNALLILVTQSIKTFFASLFILLLVQRMITRRISKLAARTRTLNVSALDEPLEPASPKARERDELDDLGSAFRDMTRSLKQAFDEQRRTQERTRFLSEASHALVDAVGKEATVDCIARLASPQLATACAVFTYDESATLRASARVASSPEQRALLEAQEASLAGLLPPERTAAVETGGRLPTSALSSAYEAYLALPLVARGSALGFLVLLFDAAHDDAYDADLARELATRAATALDNARLLAEAQRELSERIRKEDELRRSQEMFFQAQKMEALGRLVSGVAHDFNNLLAVVMGNSELVLRTLAPDDPHRENLTQVAQAGERGAALIRRLLAFGRKQRVSPTPLDVQGAIVELTPLLRRLCGEHITLVVERNDASYWVHVDRVQLEQVVINLVVNARDAIVGSGKVTISCADVDGREHDLSEGNYVALVVSDTGSGMDEATQARIFEPFFSTKPFAAGTGLGLASVAEIVGQSGGHIHVRSAPARGSTFTILLPRITPPLKREATAAEPPETGRSRSGALVLVVDDDDLVRNVTATLLRADGHVVLEAADADGALRTVRGADRPVELLVSDVGLPRVSGIDLARQLRELLPEARVLLISAYAQESIPLHGDLHIDGFLPKPFGSEALLQQVRRALTGA